MIPLLLLLLAQAPLDPPLTPNTYPWAFATVSGEACTAVGVAVMGPGFGRGNAFPLTKTFRVSPSGVRDVDGMVQIVRQTISAPADTTGAELAGIWRSQLPDLAVKLAAKVLPYTAIGTLQNTEVRTTDFSSWTPDSRTCEFSRGGVTLFVLRTRYTRGATDGAHNLHVDVLVGH